MSKTKKPRPIAEQLILATRPWTCTNFGDQSEIEAYVEATGAWETIATVHAVNGVDAEDIASFIVRAVNLLGKSEKAISGELSV